VIGRVRVREIPLADPFARVEGTGSILRLTTDILGKIVLTEEDPDLSTTAYGVISDLFRLRGGGEEIGCGRRGCAAGWRGPG
jgi:homoserine dehydrogenase